MDGSSHGGMSPRPEKTSASSTCSAVFSELSECGSSSHGGMSTGFVISGLVFGAVLGALVFLSVVKSKKSSIFSASSSKKMEKSLGGAEALTGFLLLAETPPEAGFCRLIVSKISSPL